MKRRPILVILPGLGLLAILAFVLSGVVEDIVIRPTAKFFWILKGYFGSVHDAILWGGVVLSIILIAGVSMRAESLKIGFGQEKGEKVPGDVGQLAFWIRRAPHGAYPRWYLARTLADLAMDVLRTQGANVQRGGRLTGPGWAPPGEINTYLETALCTTPATFERQLGLEGVILDPDIQRVVEYLENYLENSNEH